MKLAEIEERKQQRTAMKWSFVPKWLWTAQEPRKCFCWDSECWNLRFALHFEAINSVLISSSYFTLLLKLSMPLQACITLSMFHVDTSAPHHGRKAWVMFIARSTNAIHVGEIIVPVKSASLTFCRGISNGLASEHGANLVRLGVVYTPVKYSSTLVQELGFSAALSSPLYQCSWAILCSCLAYQPTTHSFDSSLPTPSPALGLFWLVLQMSLNLPEGLWETASNGPMQVTVSEIAPHSGKYPLEPYVQTPDLPLPMYLLTGSDHMPILGCNQYYPSLEQILLKAHRTHPATHIRSETFLPWSSFLLKRCSCFNLINPENLVDAFSEIKR